MRLIETIKGSGTAVSGDGKQQVVKYEIRVYQKEVPVGPLGDASAKIPGLKSISGTVLPVCFFGERTPVSLKMQDGRTLMFFFIDMQGSIRSTGAILDPA